MNVPDDLSEVKTGFAGQAGIPMNNQGDLHAPGIPALRVRLREFQAELIELKSRLASLEAAGDRR
jgi:hypothetical protein